jgi:hypothetical protein
MRAPWPRDLLCGLSRGQALEHGALARRQPPKRRPSLQGKVDGTAQPREVGLGNVVGGARLEARGAGLLERTRDQQEGRGRKVALQQVQRVERMEAHHAAVGKNHIRREGIERVGEGSTAVHHLHRAGRIHAPERVGLEFRVSEIILENEDAETRTLLRGHACNFGH